MIPRAYITGWRKHFPWHSNAQVEQDLVIERAMVEIFSDDFLRERLAFRGGTALHKLYFKHQARYSEDIDLVQVSPGAFGPIIDKLRDKLSFLGEPVRKRKVFNNTLVFRFVSEIPPVVNLKLKVETNCREHFTVLGWKERDFEVSSEWFSGSCKLATYEVDELLGTKLRALYQRKKGRDIFDLYRAMTHTRTNPDEIVRCFREYMSFTAKPPTRKQFLANIQDKMGDAEFLGDVTGLLRPGIEFDSPLAFELIKEQLIERL